MVRVRFLGSGDAFGSGGRLQACILLEGGDEPVLLDCGATSLVAMKRKGIEPSDIGLVLLSHLHGDHFGGLPFLILDGQFSRRERPLVVGGPPGTRERVEQAMEVLYPGSSAVKRRFDVEHIELAPGATLDVGPAKVTAFEADHASGAPALILRVEYSGKVVAYTGDTAWTEQLPSAGRDVDLLISEAYYAEKSIPFHLDYATLSANLGRIGARRVVLTHMSADMLSRPCPPGVEQAYDGAVFDLA